MDGGIPKIVGNGDREYQLGDCELKRAHVLMMKQGQRCGREGGEETRVLNVDNDLAGG